MGTRLGTHGHETRYTWARDWVHRDHYQYIPHPVGGNPETCTLQIENSNVNGITDKQWLHIVNRARIS